MKSQWQRDLERRADEAQYTVPAVWPIEADTQAVLNKVLMIRERAALLEKQNAANGEAAQKWERRAWWGWTAFGLLLGYVLAR